jgi:hypothetical protein
MNVYVSILFSSCFYLIASRSPPGHVIIAMARSTNHTEGKNG